MVAPALGAFVSESLAKAEALGKEKVEAFDAESAEWQKRVVTSRCLLPDNVFNDLLQTQYRDVILSTVDARNRHLPDAERQAKLDEAGRDLYIAILDKRYELDPYRMEGMLDAPAVRRVLGKDTALKYRERAEAAKKSIAIRDEAYRLAEEGKSREEAEKAIRERYADPAERAAAAGHFLDRHYPARREKANRNVQEVNDIWPLMRESVYGPGVFSPHLAYSNPRLSACLRKLAADRDRNGGAPPSPDYAALLDRLDRYDHFDAAEELSDPEKFLGVLEELGGPDSPSAQIFFRVFSGTAGEGDMSLVRDLRSARGAAERELGRELTREELDRFYFDVEEGRRRLLAERKSGRLLHGEVNELARTSLEGAVASYIKDPVAGIDPGLQAYNKKQSEKNGKDARNRVEQQPDKGEPESAKEGVALPGREGLFEYSRNQDKIENERPRKITKVHADQLSPEMRARYTGGDIYRNGDMVISVRKIGEWDDDIRPYVENGTVIQPLWKGSAYKYMVICDNGVLITMDRDDNVTSYRIDKNSFMSIDPAMVEPDEIPDFVSEARMKGLNVEFFPGRNMFWKIYNQDDTMTYIEKDGVRRDIDLKNMDGLHQFQNDFGPREEAARRRMESFRKEGGDVLIPDQDKSGKVFDPEVAMSLGIFNTAATGSTPWKKEFHENAKDTAREIGLKPLEFLSALTNLSPGRQALFVGLIAQKKPDLAREIQETLKPPTTMDRIIAFSRASGLGIDKTAELMETPAGLDRLIGLIAENPTPVQGPISDVEKAGIDTAINNIVENERVNLQKAGFWSNQLAASWDGLMLTGEDYFAKRDLNKAKSQYRRGEKLVADLRELDDLAKLASTHPDGIDATDHIRRLDKLETEYLQSDPLGAKIIAKVRKDSQGAIRDAEALAEAAKPRIGDAAVDRSVKQNNRTRPEPNGINPLADGLGAYAVRELPYVVAESVILHKLIASKTVTSGVQVMKYLNDFVEECDRLGGTDDPTKMAQALVNTLAKVGINVAVSEALNTFGVHGVAHDGAKGGAAAAWKYINKH